MIVKKNQILIWIFLLSTCMNGILWEVIGWMVLLLILISDKGIHNFRVLSRNEIKVLFIFFFVIAYVVMQVTLLHLNSAETIRLYGITKTVIAFLIIYFFLNHYIRNNDIVSEILPLILILNLTYIFYLITGYETLNLIGGSRNYLGVINILFIPYILKFIPPRKKITKIVWTILIILMALFLGSRTTLALTVATFLLTGLLENGLRTKIKVLLLSLLCLILVYTMLPFLGKSTNFVRAFSVFMSIKDQARIDLADSMWKQFDSYCNLQQLIGNGNNLIIWREAPPHNFIYELLLCYGTIGTFFFIFGVVITILIITTSNSLNKKYCLLIIGMALIVGLVQPFITSGYLFQCLVGIVTLGLFYKDNSIRWSS